MREKDEQTGCLLSRRQVMIFLGATSASYLLDRRRAVAQAPTATPGTLCIARPEQTEGPYFVDERLHRSDIRSDPSTGQVTPGTPLTVTVQVSRLHAGECQPVPGAQIDMWHCDAAGRYSDVRDPGFNTLGQKFLRGYQVTGPQGEVQFHTIYPGWYPIRTVHIHFKIRTAQVPGRGFEFASQWYFPDDLTDRIHTARPYSSNGRRRIRNHHDFIFRDGGDRLMLEPLETNSGYAATFPIGLVLPDV